MKSDKKKTVKQKEDIKNDSKSSHIKPTVYCVNISGDCKCTQDLPLININGDTCLVTIKDGKVIAVKPGKKNESLQDVIAYPLAQTGIVVYKN